MKWFRKKNKEVSKETKELYEVTETVDLQKGRIRLLMQDGTEYFEEIFESAGIKNAYSNNNDGSCWGLPNKTYWYQRYYYLDSLENVFINRLHILTQNEDIFFFSKKFLRSNEIKLFELVNAQPHKTETIKYVKYRE